MKYYNTIHLVSVLLILFSFITPITGQTITISIEIFFNSLHFTVTPGNALRKYYITIDLTSQYSIGTISSYEKDYSDTQKSLRTCNIKHGAGSYPVIEYQDSLTLHRKELNYKLNSFNYYLFDEQSTIVDLNDRNYAFAYQLLDDDHSITHRLKKEGQINKLQFSLYHSSSLGGVLIFGDIPESYLLDNKYMHYMDIEGNGIFWDCDIPFVLIDANIPFHIFSSKYPAYFNSMDTLIYAPSTFIFFLKENYFKTLIEENKCKYDISRGLFTCDCNYIDKLPPLSFIINKKRFTFKGPKLFYKSKDNCVFFINKSITGEKWVLGIYFWWNYLVTFDYDNKQLRFYSKTPWKSIDDEIETISSPLLNKAKIKKVMLQLIGTINIFGTVFLFYLRSNQKSVHNSF